MVANQYGFVTSLFYLKTGAPLGANWGIAGELKISNSKSVANGLITAAFSEKIGQLEENRIRSGDPFLYAKAEFPAVETSEEMQLSLLFTYLVYAQWFVNMLWLVKDNSVNFEQGFLQYPYTKAHLGVRVSSNHLSAVFTKADGDRSPVTFNTEEMKEAIGYFNLFHGPQDLDILAPGSSLVPSGDINRISRVLYFLQAARATWFLPEKVAFYCTCFESLVSTSPTELAHQVAERVAILIGNDASESLVVYRSLKRAYRTRTKLVHGGKLTDGHQRYLTDSTKCDEYLRKLLHVLIDDQSLRSALEQDPEDVDRFFLEKIFSKSNS